MQTLKAAAKKTCPALWSKDTIQDDLPSLVQRLDLGPVELAKWKQSAVRERP
jgi:hypothetical protein